MSDLIDRREAIKAIASINTGAFSCLTVGECDEMKSLQKAAKFALKELPAITPRVIRVTESDPIEMTDEQIDVAIKAAQRKVAGTEIECKRGEWLHEYLQTAVDSGIITETQASRLMDRIAEGNT